MTRRPVSVDASCPIGRVVRLMQAEGIRHVLVMDEGRLAGIASHRDVRGSLDEEGPPVSATSPVSLVMTEGPVTAAPDTPLIHAVREMLDRKIGALPVVEEGRIAGILTRADALEAFVTWAERSRTP
jgi:acetoin utilization protein AcuB